MKRTVGGALDQAALSRLHFTTLSHQEQVAAIQRLADDGMSVHGIAVATGLSVEQIRCLIGAEDD